MEKYARCMGVAHWRLNLVTGIDLSELQRTLDAQGLEVVENQKESLVGRKALADKTKGDKFLSLSVTCANTAQTFASSPKRTSRKHSRAC
jgi:hypothetical protein